MMVSLTLVVVVVCKRKYFAIVSVTTGLCQRKNARANAPLDSHHRNRVVFGTINGCPMNI